jgi:hypothetical protein
MEDMVLFGANAGALMKTLNRGQGESIGGRWDGHNGGVDTIICSLEGCKTKHRSNSSKLKASVFIGIFRPD